MGSRVATSLCPVCSSPIHVLHHTIQCYPDLRVFAVAREGNHRTLLEPFSAPAAPRCCFLFAVKLTDSQGFWAACMNVGYLQSGHSRASTRTGKYLIDGLLVFLLWLCLCVRSGWNPSCQFDIDCNSVVSAPTWSAVEVGSLVDLFN